MPLPKSFVALCLISFAWVVHGETTTRYSIAFQGMQAGEQVVTSYEDGRTVVDYAWSNNGRGLTFMKEMAIDEAGRFTHYHVAASQNLGPLSRTHSTMLAQGALEVEGRCRRARGEPRRGLYTVESSFEPSAVTARALLRQPQRTMPALPAGQLSIKGLKEATLQSAGDRRM